MRVYGLDDLSSIRGRDFSLRYRVQTDSWAHSRKEGAGRGRPTSRVRRNSNFILCTGRLNWKDNIKVDLKEQGVIVWNGFISLRIRSRGGLL
jgi:hypothetical protein